MKSKAKPFLTLALILGGLAMLVMNVISPRLEPPVVEIVW